MLSAYPRVGLDRAAPIYSSSLRHAIGDSKHLTLTRHDPAESAQRIRNNGSFLIMKESPPHNRRFLTVKQVTELHPGISERTLRHWIFCAKERESWDGGKIRLIPGNGFDQVMIRKGTKILIDVVALVNWLER
jgi:hypothetical protein